MSISLGATASTVGRLADVRIATPSERATDDACAAQDAATESLSQGIARGRTDLDRLLDQPDALAKFGGKSLRLWRRPPHEAITAA